VCARGTWFILSSSFKTSPEGDRHILLRGLRKMSQPPGARAVEEAVQVGLRLCGHTAHGFAVCRVAAERRRARNGCRAGPRRQRTVVTAPRRKKPAWLNTAAIPSPAATSVVAIRRVLTVFLAQPCLE
jgi:hypothetical protein